jgi:outer membrane murein-binding lipoprotein Lpp
MAGNAPDILPIMKKLVLLLVPVLALPLACTTTSFAGLARTSYVDEVSAAREATQSELEQLRVEVDAMQELADQLEEVIAAMEETQRATEELQELAAIVEARLESLPRETLRLLVESIQAFLEE